MLISQWGKSLAIRLPKALVAKLGVREGDDVDIRQVGENRLAIVTRDGRSATFEVLRTSAKQAPAKSTPRISP
ncbi:MAG: AbrB/MazE/SpoVT family DNA-binding domain-containing protein [Roseiarcus sp.]|jgi:antitoxin MazE